MSLCLNVIFTGKRTINLLSCNVNGFSDHKKCSAFASHFLFPSSSSCIPHVIALQDTRSGTTEVTQYSSQLYSTVLFAHPEQGGHAGGVLLAFQDIIDHKILACKCDPKGRYVVAQVSLEGEDLVFVNVYLSPHLSATELQDTARSISQTLVDYDNERIVWCGDFNAILNYELDTTRRRVTTLHDLTVKATMQEWELTDVWRILHPTERRYTCFTRSHNALSWLDYIFASPSFLTHVLDSSIGAAYCSDHSPVWMTFSLTENDRGRGFWKIPDYVLNDSDYREKVAEDIQHITICNENTPPGLLWDTIKTSLRGITIKHTAELKHLHKNQVESVEQQINQSVFDRDTCNDPQQAHRYDNKVRYLQLELDDIFAVQNARKLWFNQAQKYFFSEKCSKYFLRPKLCRKNAIKSLVDPQGNKLSSDKELLEEAHRFYSKVYRAESHRDAFNTGLLAKFLNKIPGDRLSLKSHQMLDKDITLEELHMALKAMKTDTSPGSDGFTFNCYLQFWSLVGRFVLASLQDAWSQGKMSISQRHGLLRLIPKEGKNLLDVGNWRPITLLNVDYKILTKTLARRLSQVLPDIIHSDQKGFVKNRYSGKNVLDVYAMIH